MPGKVAYLGQMSLSLKQAGRMLKAVEGWWVEGEEPPR